MAEPELMERLPLQNVPPGAEQDPSRWAQAAAHRWLPRGTLWLLEQVRWFGWDQPQAPEPAAELQALEVAREERDRLRAAWEAVFAGIAKTDAATTSVRPRRKARERARVAWAEWQAAEEAEAAREADYWLARENQMLPLPEELEAAISRLELLRLEIEAAVAVARRYRLSTSPTGRRLLVRLGEIAFDFIGPRKRAIRRRDAIRQRLQSGPPAELFEEAEALSAAES